MDGDPPAPNEPSAPADEALDLAGSSPAFRRTTVSIEPGGVLGFRAADWADCLVVVAAGEIELHTTSGVRHTCRAGDVLWLAGLSLRRLVNPGPGRVVLTAVRRATGTMGSPTTARTRRSAPTAGDHR